MGIGFVCRTTYTAYRVFDSNLNTLFSQNMYGGIGWFAADQANDCFYVTENSVLTKRSLSDGTLLATEFESVGAQRPIVIDSGGNLWTIDDGLSNVIRKWDSDLTTRIDYTLKAGVLAGLVYNLCLSYDEQYIWLLGWDDLLSASCVIAKFAISNIDGGDPEWTYQEGLYSLYQLVVDENDNIYFGYNKSGTVYTDPPYYTYENIVQKVNSNGVAQWSSVHRGGTLVCYDKTRSVIYANYFEDSRTTIRRFSEINLSGSVLAKTTELIGTWNSTSCFIFDNYLVGFIANDRVHLIDISSGISEGEDSVVNTDNSYLNAMGDPTGYINSNFTQESAFNFTANVDNVKRHFYHILMRETGTVIQSTDYDTLDHWSSFIANFTHIGFCANESLHMDLFPKVIVSDLGEEIVASYDGTLEFDYLQTKVADFTAVDDMKTKDCDVLLIGMVNHQFCYLHDKEFLAEKKLIGGDLARIKIKLTITGAEYSGLYGFYYNFDEVPSV